MSDIWNYLLKDLLQAFQLKTLDFAICENRNSNLKN